MCRVPWVWNCTSKYDLKQLVSSSISNKFFDEQVPDLDAVLVTW